MSNTQRAINEFRGYERELVLGIATTARREHIRQQAVTCDDLMSYSPDDCWDRSDFRDLHGVVGRVLSLSQ